MSNNGLKDKSLKGINITSDMIAIAGKPIIDISSDFNDFREDVVASSLALYTAHSDLRKYIDKLTGVDVNDPVDIPTLSFNLISNKLDPLGVDKHRGVVAQEWKQVGSKQVFSGYTEDKPNLLAIPTQVLKPGKYFIVLEVEDLVIDTPTKVEVFIKEGSNPATILKDITETGKYRLEFHIVDPNNTTVGITVKYSKLNQRVAISQFKVYRISNRIDDYMLHQMETMLIAKHNRYGFLTKQDLVDSNFKDSLVKQEDLNKYVTRDEVDNAGVIINRAKIEKLKNDFDKHKEVAESTYAKKTDVQSNGTVVDVSKFITKELALESFALKGDIPDVSGYAKQEYCDDSFVKKDEVNDYVVIPDMSDKYATVEFAENKYMSKVMLANLMEKYPSSNMVAAAIDAKLSEALKLIYNKNDMDDLYMKRSEMYNTFTTKEQAEMKYTEIENKIATLDDKTFREFEATHVKHKNDIDDLTSYINTTINNTKNELLAAINQLRVEMIGERDRLDGRINESINYTNTTRDTINNRITTEIAKVNYKLCDFYYFRRTDICDYDRRFVPATGGLIENADRKYPEAWDYLLNHDLPGLPSLKLSEKDWQYWVGVFGGVGGGITYVQNVDTKTLRVPDLRCMHIEATRQAVDFNVGNWHQDQIRPIRGTFCKQQSNSKRDYTEDPFFDNGFRDYIDSGTSNDGSWRNGIQMNTAQLGIHYNGARTQPAGWSALPTAFLGEYYEI